jgi:4-amino-4-deoxy-L-arabinose transferase-like glycosyltransferase
MNKSVLWILGLGLLVRGIIAFWLPAGYDEAYYYLYTQNPDWSFFDHPPMVAITTAIGLWLSFDVVSPFTIRLGSLILHTATLALLFHAARRLFTERVALLTLLLASVIPIFVVAFGTMTLPDVPLMFFWVAVLWGAVEEFFQGEKTEDYRPTYRPTYRLAILGTLVGLACVSKYHGFLLGAGLVGFCLTTARFRKALISPWMLLGLVGFGVMMSPVVIWNMQHNWESFTFQAGRSVSRESYSILRVLEVLGVQSLYLFPVIGVPLIWVLVRSLLHQLRSPFNRRMREPEPDLILKQRLVLWLSAPVILIFTFVGGYRQVLPTWTMPGWFIATVLLAYRVAIWQDKAPKVTKRWLGGSTIAVLAILTVTLGHISFGTSQIPSRNPFIGVLPIASDPSVQLLDVLQLRENFRKQPEMVKALKQSDFVFSNRYHLSGHFAMALDPIFPRPMTCFDIEDMRGFEYWSRPEDWVGKTGLYLTTKELHIAENSVAVYESYFKNLRKIGEIPLDRGGFEINRIFVYQATELLTRFPRPLQNSQGA